MLVTKTAFQHSLQLHSAYPSSDTTPTFVVGPRSQYRIDHVLASPSLHPALVMEIMSEHEREHILQRGLPNNVHPSDHLPVACVLQWLE